MFTKPPLGRLERVDLRTAWQNEAQDFTPWLAQAANIAILGETLGIELEVESTEERVGAFRADILARNSADDSVVLIENQLGVTDHRHLGQILTYASGLDAVTIVWVAATVNEEHRAAIDWLNRISEERFSFFAVEVELWKIGGSAPAPKFNIVAKPNEWTKAVREAAQAATAGSTETRGLRREYWTSLQRYFREQGGQFKIGTPPGDAWTNYPLGKARCHLGAFFSVQNAEIQVYLILGGPQAKHYFSQLHAQRGEVESALGFPVTWLENRNHITSRVEIRHSAETTARSQWPEQHAWMLARLAAFDRAFRARVVALRDPDDAAEDDEAEDDR